MRVLDGWKSFVVVIGVIVSNGVFLATGYDMRDLVLNLFLALHWSSPALIEFAQRWGLVVVPLVFALIAAYSRLKKAHAQSKAGATAGELLGPAGYVKAALQDGSLKVIGPDPVKLVIADGPVVTSTVIAQPVAP